MPISLPTLSHLSDVVGQCTACPLAKSRCIPAVYRGAERADVMIIGDVPTDADDAVGVPFAGEVGEGLDKMVLSVGLSLADMHITHLVKCHSPESRRPTKTELDACRWFLDAQIDLVRPRVIVVLGVVVTQALTSATRFLEARGRWHEYRGILVMPTHHPSHLYRNADLRRGSQRDMQLVAAKLGRTSR